ncbi:hypothetical protein EDD40_2745 [Saccharothrix texasensis]|uniref:Secreted protein n=1 Tax=Saccharothrix texasensis TaxID=103734 RepID=A0A3N1H5E6_9PSEU|nr:hypothetical protein EDD40_2745 [Saccharothrix texasensis]
MRAFIGIAVLLGLFVACSTSGDDEPTRSGPSGMYSEEECLALQWDALSDAGSEDVQTEAAAKYTVHCQP